MSPAANNSLLVERSKTYITTIRCNVLGKDIPVPKNLLAFNSLATVELLQSFAFAPKEDIKCNGYPEGGLRLQHIQRGNKNYIGGSVKANVFSSFLNTGDNCSGLLAESCSS